MAPGFWMTTFTSTTMLDRTDADPVAPVRVWLWCIAALIFAMMLVGGATRLMEAGLSITEWKPIAGVLPPLSAAAWQAEFDKYKQIPQFAKLFPDMTLAGFKTIFFWEWSHRMLGRLIGLAVAAPMAWFWLSGRLPGWLKPRLVGLLALGGLQGVVGWWMVASGLVGRVEVAPERLATHLVLATLTLVVTVWLGIRLKPVPAEPSTACLRGAASWLLTLVVAQIGLGALVAGSRAGWTYNTWPLMDGRLVPPTDDLTRLSPIWKNPLENLTLVQFDHRMIAYALIALAVWHAWSASRRAGGTSAARRAVALAGLVIVQASLGILTLLLVVPVWAALLHQAVAMMTLVMATIHRARLRAT
jgi:cytochrome c oxidase assembly protein subunit 15